MLLQKAITLRDVNISVIGCHTKRPVMSWQEFQKSLPTDRDLSKMFTERAASQIAIICGAVSNNLEVIDVDVKDDDTIADKIMADFTDYFDGDPSSLLTCIKTQSGGLHFYYRCSTIEGNQKLAKKATKEVILETRGEGGYVIAPPSEGYSILFGSLSNIKEISPDQRDDLLSMCRSYNEYEYVEYQSNQSKHIPSHEYAETPWDNYNNDTSEPWIKVLSEAGWEEVKDLETSDKIFFKRPGTTAKQSANWHKDKRLFYVWSSSTEFEPEKAYTPTAILAIVKYNGDFTKTAIALKKQNYGSEFKDFEKSIINKAVSQFESGLTLDLISELLEYDFNQSNITNTDHKKKLLKAAKYKNECKQGLFWTLGNRGKLSINVLKFAEFLSECGFYRLYSKYREMSFDIVHLNANEKLSYYTDTALIKDELDKILQNYNWADFDITMTQAREIITELSVDGWKKIFEKLEYKIMEDVNFIRDEENTCYFPFKNNVVKITKEDIAPIPYKDLSEDQFVWFKQIVQSNVEIKEQRCEVQKCDSDFYRFVKRLAGVPKTPNGIPADHKKVMKDYFELIEKPNLINAVPPDDYLMYFEPHLLPTIGYTDLGNKIMSIITTLGYLLCNYKDPANAYCITIAEDTEDEGKGGGTGKSLIMEGIRKLRNLEKEDGKTWKIDSTFAFQKIRYGLDIFYIEDVKKKFDFETIYNLISNDAVIERKNQTAFSMSFKETPKIVLSTNYDVDTEGDHSNRRNKKILVSRYFNIHHQPTDEFSKRFFDQWDETDWNDFYNAMFSFVQYYLNFGIIDFKETNQMKLKAIKLKYGEEFLEHMLYFFLDYDGADANINAMYDDFVEDYDNKRYWSLKRFGKAIAFLCEKFGVEYDSKRKRVPGDYKAKQERFYKFEKFSILKNIAKLKRFA